MQQGPEVPTIELCAGFVRIFAQLAMQVNGQKCDHCSSSEQWENQYLNP